MKLKKWIICLLSVLCLAVALVGCDNGNEPDDGNGSETPDIPDTPDTPETPDTPDVPDTPDTPDISDMPDTPDIPETPDDPDGGTPDAEPLGYAVRESYLPAELTELLYGNFLERSDIFVRMYQAYAPYTYFDVLNLSGCRVLSITIPILVVKDADENGDFVFTLHKVGNKYNDMSRAPVASYEIKINKDTYGITPGDTKVYKLVTVDLTEFDITLSATETLAFGKTSDTVIPAYLHSDSSETFEELNAYCDLFPRGLGVIDKIGKGYHVDNVTLCFDLQIERTYESEEAYLGLIAKAEAQELAYTSAVEKLKEIYKGKNVSVLGDSISSFDGLSKNKDYNVTLSNNASAYYPAYDNFTSNYTKTYWGRLITDLDMKLCVNNSWSGAHAYGVDSRSNLDALPKRATELHRDGGTAGNRSDDTDPDLIIVYMGINDTKYSNIPIGDILSTLNTNDGRSDNEKVDAWFKKLIEKYESNGRVVKKGVTYNSFAEAYALGIYLMQQKYADVEILCLTLIQNYTSGLTASRIASFNRVISAVATYLGATVIDQSGELSELNFSNSYMYSSSTDSECVHPGVSGHALMERLIVKTLAKKHNIAFTE